MEYRGWILFLLGLLAAGDGAAQQQAPALFQFRISNPGARSLGFGGAFAALADDATAAYVNPAGLAQLLRRELSAEVRVTIPSHGGDSEPELSGVGFTSFVYPWKRFSAAVYRAELATIGILSFSGQDPIVAVENAGIAGAWRVSDRLSVGLGLARFAGDFAASSPLLPAGAAVLRASTADGNDLRWNAGFLWHLPRGWSVGGFFRQGPSFELAAEVVAAGTPGVPPGTVLASDPRVPFELGDVFGLGVAYRSGNGAVTVSGEWDRLGSASLLEDGDELHLGIELALLRTSPLLAVRLGAWRDADRGLLRPGGEPRPRPLFPVGGGETHLAAGFGVAYKRLKLDFGFDHSDPVDTVSVSIVYSFSRRDSPAWSRSDSSSDGIRGSEGRRR